MKVFVWDLVASVIESGKYLFLLPNEFIHLTLFLITDTRRLLHMDKSLDVTERDERSI